MRLIDADALHNDLKESAKAVKEWIEETQDEEIKIRAEQAYGTFVECALRVKNAPTIDPEMRRGRWLPKDSKTAKCSCCGWWQHTKMYYLPDDIAAFAKCYRFCTACGVQMDGGAAR